MLGLVRLLRIRLGRLLVLLILRLRRALLLRRIMVRVVLRLRLPLLRRRIVPLRPRWFVLIRLRIAVIMRALLLLLSLLEQIVLMKLWLQQRWQ